MRSCILMWKYPQMVVLTAITAALYATAYIALSPFSIDLVPGVLSFSIRTIFPMVFGILFGPAGAWGLGIGNIVGDLFTGSLALGSVFGFLSNALLGYLGFTLWSRFGPRPAQFDADVEDAPAGDRVRPVLTYLAIGVVAAAASAVVLAWGLDLLGFVPFRVVAVTLAANFVIGNWVGGLLYLLLHRRVRAMGVTWDEIMDLDEPPGRGPRALLGTALVAVGGIAGWLVGIQLGGSDLLTPVVGVGFVAVLLGSLLL